MNISERLANALLEQSQANGRNCLELTKNGMLVSRPLKKGKKRNIAGGRTSANALIEYFKTNEDNFHKLAESYRQKDKFSELNAMQAVINELFERKNKLKKAPDLFLHINENWMRDLPVAAKQRKMNEFVLPGTHDSGAYRLELTKTPKGSSKVRLDIISKIINIGKFLGVKKLLKDLTMTQHYNFKNQLNLGARYFDLRVSYNAFDNRFYLSHTFACVPLEDALRDISEFMKAHPCEVIVLQVQPDAPHKRELNEHKDKLYGLLHAHLGDIAVKHDGSRKPNINEFGTMHYDELIQKNQRVVFGMKNIKDPANSDYLKLKWDSNINDQGWLNQSSISSGLNKIESKIDNSIQNPDKMHCIATSLTPKNEEYVQRGLRKYLPFLKRRNVLANEGLNMSIVNLGRKMNEHIPEKFNDHYHGIVYCDSPDHSGAFNHLISLNKPRKLN